MGWCLKHEIQMLGELIILNESGTILRVVDFSPRGFLCTDSGGTVYLVSNGFVRLKEIISQSEYNELQ